MRRPFTPWVLGVVLVIGACTDRPMAPYPISPPPPTMDAALGPGDLFDVRVFDELSLSSSYQVPQNGQINFPLIGLVQVEGRLPTEIETEIQSRLAAGFLKNPTVSVRVTEYRSKKITVYGQVRTPGTFSFNENMSIVEAISRAGGFTYMARKNAVKVTRLTEDRKTQLILVAVDDIGKGKAPNFLLRPGDVVFVDERPY